MSESIDLYKAKFRILFKTLFILYIIPNTLINFAIQAMVGFFTISKPSIATALGVGFGVGIPALVGSVIVSCIMAISTIKIISEDKTMGIVDRFKDSMKYFVKFLGMSFGIGIALMFLFLLLIIPGIIFAVFWTFASIILIVENKSPIDSLTESKKLVTGNWFKVFGYDVIFFILIMIVSLMISIPVGFASIFVSFIPVIGVALQSFAFDIITIVTTPISISFLYVFYKKLKAEKGLPPAPKTFGSKYAKK